MSVFLLVFRSRAASRARSKVGTGPSVLAGFGEGSVPDHSSEPWVDTWESACTLSSPGTDRHAVPSSLDACRRVLAALNAAWASAALLRCRHAEIHEVIGLPC